MDSIARKTTSDSIITATRATELPTERQMIIGSDNSIIISNTINTRATLPMNGVEHINTCESLDKFGYESCHVHMN